MTPEIPNSRQTPEAEQKLTPRQRLEKFLEGEKPGSIKSKAVADMARLEVLEHKITVVNREPDRIPQISLLGYATEYAALNETIRVRKFDENGTEYIKAYEDAKAIFDHYFNDPENPRSISELFSKDGAGRAIENDLLQLNSNKASKASQGK